MEIRRLQQKPDIVHSVRISGMGQEFFQYLQEFSWSATRHADCNEGTCFSRFAVPSLPIFCRIPTGLLAGKEYKCANMFNEAHKRSVIRFSSPNQIGLIQFCVNPGRYIILIFSRKWQLEPSQRERRRYVLRNYFCMRCKYHAYRETNLQSEIGSALRVGLHTVKSIFHKTSKQRQTTL